MSAISVVIADRRHAGRAACRGLLTSEKDIRVIGEVTTGMAAVTAAEQLKPSILLLDLDLFDGATGSTLLPVIRRRSPETRVLILTRRGRTPKTIEALCHGARGYLEKERLRMFLPRAVRAVDAGEAWVPRKMVAKIMDRMVQLTRPA